MIEAKYYEKLHQNKVKCNLCPNTCIINDGDSGICFVRKNMGGRLFAIGYGQISSQALDPIEKKPLNHFYPGSQIYSVGSYGCNLSCKFCQNYSISKNIPETIMMEPYQLIETAKSLQYKGNIGLAFTYNEPFINFEYVLDTFKLAKKEGLKTVLVSNGFVKKEPLEELIEYTDAVNIDLKAFDSKLLNLYCGISNLEAIKETIVYCAKRCKTEITTLIVPHLNDNLKDIEELAKWIRSVDSNIPYHITRFYPRYLMSDIEPTNMDLIIEARKVAQKHLKFVY